MPQQQKQPSQVDLLLSPDASDGAFTRAVQRLDPERRQKLKFIIEARLERARQQAAAVGQPEPENAASAQQERLQAILHSQAAPLAQSLTKIEQFFYAFLIDTYQQPEDAWRRCHELLLTQTPQAVAGQFQATPAVFGPLKATGMFGGKPSAIALPADDLATILTALVTARADKQTLGQLGIPA